MSTNKYRCLQTRVVQDEFVGTSKETKFVAGKDYPLEDATYARWERRGVFGPIPDKKRGRQKRGEETAEGNSDGQAADAGERAKSASKAPAPGAVMGAVG